MLAFQTILRSSQRLQHCGTRLPNNSSPGIRLLSTFRLQNGFSNNLQRPFSKSEHKKEDDSSEPDQKGHLIKSDPSESALTKPSTEAEVSALRAEKFSQDKEALKTFIQGEKSVSSLIDDLEKKIDIRVDENHPMMMEDVRNDTNKYVRIKQDKRMDSSTSSVKLMKAEKKATSSEWLRTSSSKMWSVEERLIFWILESSWRE